MIIEKINDMQIRCTLTREDLAERQMQISELAYGTEKAKDLFRDMMQQAAYEYGFEADDIPLMIEAIPVSSEKVVLLVTKVEYPDELDTRFSRFSEPDPEDLLEDSMDDGDLAVESADDILGLFRRMQEQRAERVAGQPMSLAGSVQRRQREASPEAGQEDVTNLFVFGSLPELTRIARVLGGFYEGENDLYKNEATRKYYLFVRKGRHTMDDFNRACNILAEYAPQGQYTDAVEAYFREHCRLIRGGDALQCLRSL